MRVILLVFSIGVFFCHSQEQKTYSQLIQEITTKKNILKRKHDESVTIAAKDSIVISARNYLENKVSEMFPYWYGTEWDFNGTTRVPGQGQIACGYFVTAILTDLKFKIPRIKWAQSASEVFIKVLSKGHIKRFSNTSILNIDTYFKTFGDGLYLVGLDSHTGFVLVKSGNASFVHADYYDAETGVKSEVINSNNPLRDSNYRVIGKLFSDEMVVKWLNGIEYK